MIAVRVKWNDRHMRLALARMHRKGGNFTPALRELRAPLRTDLAAHAKRQEGPDGKWPRRAERTTARYVYRASIRKTPTLKKRIRRSRRGMLGMLPRAVTFKAGRKSLLAVSKVKWSGVHQTGGKVGRGSILPARPHVFVSDGFFNYASRHIMAYVMKEWGA